MVNKKVRKSKNRKSRSNGKKKTKRSNKQKNKKQRGSGYNLGVNQARVGGQAVVNKNFWCDNKTPVNLSSNGLSTGEPNTVVGMENQYTANNSSVNQTGGGYFLDTSNPSNFIVNEAPVVGVSNGAEGCLNMSNLKPAVSGFGKCEATCDKNPYLVTKQAGGTIEKISYHYSMIVNPKTGRKVKLNGKLGRSILRTYVKKQRGGWDVNAETPEKEKEAARVASEAAVKAESSAPEPAPKAEVALAPEAAVAQEKSMSEIELNKLLDRLERGGWLVGDGTLPPQ